MKRALALLICAIFLVTGLIRVGVSLVVIGELQGWWVFGGEAAQAVAETREFIAQAPTNFAGFTPLTYFAFLLFMGAVVSLGALAQVWRRGWGMALIGLYLACHSFLFVNFMTINPKIGLVALAAALAGILIWANGADRNRPNPALAA